MGLFDWLWAWQIKRSLGDTRELPFQNVVDVPKPKPAIVVLLGGLWGSDGFVTSAGIVTLAKMLEPFGNVQVLTWDKYADAAYIKIPRTARGKVILIGYSGGGSRATWLASTTDSSIDLLIAIDPSPSRQVRSLGPNVKRAICFHNNNPMMPSIYGPLGGGRLTGIKDIATHEISEQHLLVQYDGDIREKVIAAVRAAVA
jgi:pimeloyl-ACP methyl ester carboxylesterase